MRVTFDTNIFSHIVRPEGCHDPDIKAIAAKIRQFIEIGRILPFVSETVFSLEGIEKKDRPEYFGNYEASIQVETLATDERSAITQRICIGPNLVGRPATNPILLEKLDAARKLGFIVLPFPRIGLPRHPSIVDDDFRKDLFPVSQERLDRLFEAGRFIDSLGAGFTAAKAIAKPFRKNERAWFHALKFASPKTAGEAIAEWADGDSVAAHISLDLDYFCTRDQAKTSGSKSVFSPANREKLTEEFNIAFVSPEELLLQINAEVSD